MFFEVLGFIVEFLDFLFSIVEPLDDFVVSSFVVCGLLFLVFEKFVVSRDKLGEIVIEDGSEEDCEESVEGNGKKKKVKKFQLH